jgi:hypothetical protein
MPSLEERTLERLDRLIGKGDAVRATRRQLPPNVITSVTLDAGAFAEWQSQALSFLTNLLGSEHIYVERFATVVRKASSSSVTAGQGILRAVREDVQGGYLIDVRTLVSADVFSDFLDMAEHLHENGYKDPAASLAGAVLEDGMRRIADNNGIQLKSREDLGSLNQKLANADVYNRVTQRRLQPWITVRNHADHGEFDEYTTDDVADMIRDIIRFLNEYLT